MSRSLSASSPQPSCHFRLPTRRSARAACTILFGVFLGSATAARPADDPGQRTLSGTEFAAEVAQIEARLHAAEKDPRASGALADSLPGGWMVGERRVSVSAGRLRAVAEEYAREPARRNALRPVLEAQIGELQDLAARLSSSQDAASAPDAPTARARLGQILARRDFQSAMRGSQWELWKARLLHWLYNKLESLFRVFPSYGRGGKIFLWVMIGILAAVLAVWLFSYFRRHGTETAPAIPPPPAGLTWRDWFQHGLEAAQAGRYRDAVHALYWAAVYRLEELHVWSLDRARTPREYLRLMAARAAAPPSGELPPQLTTQQRRALEALTRGFELTWYGYRQAGQEDFQAALAQVEVFGCRPL